MMLPVDRMGLGRREQNATYKQNGKQKKEGMSFHNI